jgi:hypothetical protein
MGFLQDSIYQDKISNYPHCLAIGLRLSHLDGAAHTTVLCHTSAPATERTIVWDFHSSLFVIQFHI